jgi:hypothetical protein
MGWTAKESACKAEFVNETSTTSISYSGPLLAAHYFHKMIKFLIDYTFIQ